ncbi:hypothetical protein D3C71_1772740 [compost metagenome]
MVGHAIVVGARAIGHHNATRLGVLHGNVLVPGAQRADERQLGQRVDLRGAETRGADGQHRGDARAVCGDGRCGLGRVRCVDQIKRLRQLGAVVVGEEHEGEQDGLHGKTNVREKRNRNSDVFGRGRQALGSLCCNAHMLA